MELETLGTSSLIRKVRDFTLKTETRPGVSKVESALKNKRCTYDQLRSRGLLTFPQELLIDFVINGQVDVIVFLTTLR